MPICKNKGKIDEWGRLYESPSSTPSVCFADTSLKEGGKEVDVHRASKITEPSRVSLLLLK